MWNLTGQACFLCTRKCFYTLTHRNANIFIRNNHVLQYGKRNISRPLCHKRLHIVTRSFHTSGIRKAAPLLGPLLVKLISPIPRIFLFLFGRRFRKWWSALPKEQRDKYISNLTKNRNRLFGVGGCFGVISAGFYMYHIEETPITGRRRFMLLEHEQVLKVLDAETRLYTERLAKSRLPVTHPLHTRVYEIMKRILRANNLDDNDLMTKVNVIIDDDINAFVFANGDVYVFTGLLNVVANDHELAGILGHELCHAILHHSAEQLSRSGFFNVFSIAISTVIWVVTPDALTSIIASYVQNKIEDILINLPYSRTLEKEADEVGMMFAAKACYDVSQIPKFWGRMDAAMANSPEENIDWLSTHPSHDKRVNWLHESLPKALEINRQMQCPSYPSFWEAIRKWIF